MQIATLERTRRIQAILTRRHPLREKIASVEENLRSLTHCLSTLVQDRDRLISQQRSGTWSGNPTVSSRKDRTASTRYGSGHLRFR